MRKVRIVVDLNVYISAALARKADRLGSPALAVLDALHTGKCEGLICAEMLYELADRLRYRRFGFRPDFILEFISLVDALCTLVPIRALDIGGRDDADDKVIQTAIDGRADAV
jgi:putative PIN family toxin of toxin-antitoxin system